MTIFAIVVTLGFPAVVLRFRHARFVDAASPIVICYVAGILLGNTVLTDTESSAVSAMDSLQSATVLLAIPLLLFSADLRRWSRLARPTVVAFALAIITIVVIAPITANVFGDLGEDPANVAGMTVGVYTGGTANMAAIATALDVEESVFVALNGADIVISSLYLLALLSVLPGILSRWMRPFVPPDGRDTPTRASDQADDLAEVADDPWAERLGARAVAAALGAGLAGVLLAASVALGLVSVLTDTEMILDSDAFATAVVLLITTVGVLGSLVRRVRELPGTYTVGQYLFLSFGVAIGTLANLRDLAGAVGDVFPFMATTLVLAVVVHHALCAVMRIDRDTAVITSTAAVFGPPFVGPVAGALGNRDIVVSGMTTGVVGLAVGNYAGLAVAKLLG